MEETPQNKDGISKDVGCASAKMQEAEETRGRMPEFLLLRDPIMLNLGAYFAKADELSKKPKLSSSGEVVSSANGCASPLPSLPHPSCPTELNVATQSSTAATRESCQLVSGRMFFRMLIPTEYDDEICYDQDKLFTIVHEQNAEINIYRLAGAEIVIVWAEEDPHSFLKSSPALEGFVRAHKYLSDAACFSDFPFCKTRLLVTAEQAKNFMRSKDFEDISEEFYCSCSLYLADKSLSVLPDGDVIIKLAGSPSLTNQAVKIICTFLGQSPVDESLISKSKYNVSTLGGRPSARENSANRLPTMETCRRCEVLRRLTIPLSYVDAIIGENGVNIVNIDVVRQKCPVTISLFALKSAARSGGDDVFIDISGSHDDCVFAERMMEGYINVPFFEGVDEIILFEEPPSSGEPYY